MEFRRQKFSPKCTVQSKTRNTLDGISFSTNSYPASSPKMAWAVVSLAVSLAFAAVLGACFPLSKGQFSQRK